MEVMFRELSRMFANPTRIKLLKFFILQPSVKVPAHEAAVTVGASRFAVETELRALVRLGVIVGKKSGRRTHFSLALGYPHAEALRHFFEAVTQPREKVIADAFRGVPGVTLLVATGILLRDLRPSVDLLIVTKRPKHPNIARAVRKVEAIASVPIRYAVLETRDYEGRLVARDRLLRDVFEFSNSVIVGKT